jgi:hypothetical protein
VISDKGEADDHSTLLSSKAWALIFCPDWVPIRNTLRVTEGDLIFLMVPLHQEIIICLENSLFSLEMLENSFKAIKTFSRQIKGFKTFKIMFFISMISTENMVLKVLKPLICLENALVALKLFSSISRENKLFSRQMIIS